MKLPQLFNSPTPSNPSSTSDSSTNLTRLAPLFFVSIIVFIFILFGFLIYASINRHFATVDLLFTPASSTVKIDGKTYAAGKFKLSPGSHQITIEKYGFTSIEETLELSSNQTTLAYYILTPNADFTQTWYKTNPDDARLAEGITSYLFDASSNNTLKKYPALSKLPVQQTNFSIYQSSCNDAEICIFIDAEPAHYESALTYFKSKIDSDIGRYHFIFKNYSNPFKGEG